MTGVIGSVRLYSVVSRQAFQNALAYRANYYIGLARELVFLYLSVLLWRALYESGVAVTDATLVQAITYIGMSRLMSVGRQIDLRPLLEARVISGEIAGDLIRPYDFQAYLFARMFGTALHNLVMKALPMFGVAYVFWGVEIPFGLERGVWFVISVAVGYLVAFLIDFMVGMMTFWTTEMWSFTTLKMAVVTVMSGALVPLWLYPEGLAEVMKWLPFAAIWYIPGAIYVGYLPTVEIAPMILRQLLWAALLTGACRLIWLRAVSRLSVQGG